VLLEGGWGELGHEQRKQAGLDIESLCESVGQADEKGRPGPGARRGASGVEPDFGPPDSSWDRESKGICQLSRPDVFLVFLDRRVDRTLKRVVVL